MTKRKSDTMASTPQSRKAKGRRLQQWVRDFILGLFPDRFTEDDVRSTSMGAGGEDVLLSSFVREVLPYSIECKNVEKLNVWRSYEQASENCGDCWEPVVVIKRNHQKPLVVIDAEYFFNLHKGD